MKRKTPTQARAGRLVGGVAAAAITVGLVSCSGGATTGQSLVVTYMDSGTYNTAAESLVPAFEEANDAEVTIEAYPFSTLGQQNATDLITGTGAFDVMSISSWDVEVFGQLQPIGERIDSWSNKDQYIQALLENGPTPYADGQPVGLTYASDAYGVFINTDYLPADTTFATWDDLIAAASGLQSSLPEGVVPISFAFGAADQIPSIFQGAYDSYYINADGQWDLDEAKAIRAMEQIGEIVDLGASNAASLSIDEANESFLAGDAAILIGWPSFVRGALNDDSRSSIGDAWAQTPFPGPGTPALSAWSLSLSSLSKNQDLGWKWIEDYVTPENATEWMFSYGIGSPFQSTYDDPELLESHANDLPVQAENLGKAMPLPLTLKSFEAFTRPLGEYVSGSGSASDAVAAIRSGWNSMDVPEALISTADANGFVQK